MPVNTSKALKQYLPLNECAELFNNKVVMFSLETPINRTLHLEDFYVRAVIAEGELYYGRAVLHQHHIYWCYTIWWPLIVSGYQAFEMQLVCLSN